MGDKSRIEWTDATWNPVVGCTRVSAGCDNCYAVRETKRMAGKLPVYQGLVNPGKDHFNGTVRTIPERLDQPIRWKRPRRIFVNSMSDLFHPGVPDEFVDQVFAVMAVATHHVFQVLTKRPERMARWALARKAMFDSGWAPRHPIQLCIERIISSRATPERAGLWQFPLPNVGVGTSIEDQESADERIPHLLRTPAAVRFLSCEPLLGPVELPDFFADSLEPVGHPEGGVDALATSLLRSAMREGRASAACGIHQVIAGGESGPNARPMHPDWARSLRNQCQAAGVAFHFKQWGEWAPHTIRPGGDLGGDVRRGHVQIVHPGGESILEVAEMTGGRSTLPGSLYMARVGKHPAGRLLDGRTWDEEPPAERDGGSDG